jgi:phenylacetate-CoA ligase
MKLKRQLHKIYSCFGPRGQKTLEYLYRALPLGIRKKKGFWKYLEFLRKSQWNSPDWHIEYQNEQLKDLLLYAAKNSPFYLKTFLKHQIEVKEIRSSTDLTHIPVLNKSTLIDQVEEFLPTNFPIERLIKNSTSGSTGSPFEFRQDYYAVMREEAFAVRHWENAGMTFGEPTVFLRTYIPNEKESLYKYSPAENRHYLSAYHLDKSNLSFYLENIKSSGARFIFGYPSSLEILADLLIEAGQKLDFEAAITGSEKLSSNARSKIESALNTGIYDWYGLAEPTVTMGQCQNGSYHVFSEYGIVELLDANDSPIVKEGETGRIVGTNFTNRALPLIRYDTGDLGTFTTKQCACGRGTPVVVSGIEGRKDDLLIGANGQFLPSVNFYSLFAKYGKQVQRFQLIQKNKFNFSLKIIRGPEFSENSVKTIIEGLNQRIGGRPDIEIETVERIIPAGAGKIRSVVREYTLPETTKERINEN